MEIWKDVVGYEGFYEVSTHGRVRSLKRGLVLKQGVCGKYNNVVLCKNGIRKTKAVHRLVATAFCLKADWENEVNHINEDKKDNRADNLEWCTRIENIRHGSGIARHAYAQRFGSRNKAISKIDENGDVIETYISMRDMQRKTGFDRRFISKCIKGKCTMAYGYKWEYADIF